MLVIFNKTSRWDNNDRLDSKLSLSEVCSKNWLSTPPLSCKNFSAYLSSCATLPEAVQNRI